MGRLGGAYWKAQPSQGRRHRKEWQVRRPNGRAPHTADRLRAIGFWPKSFSMQPGSIGFAALSNVDAIELRIAPSQAPTPAALCRVERLRSGEAVNASGGEVTRN